MGLLIFICEENSRAGKAVQDKFLKKSKKLPFCRGMTNYTHKVEKLT
jgi:hypothetical protein